MEKSQKDGTILNLARCDGEGKPVSSDPNIIVFLCPNGHKLNGPATLKGKPGKCPHCDTRFLIPDDDDLKQHHADAASQSGPNISPVTPHNSGSNLNISVGPQTKAGGSGKSGSAVSVPGRVDTRCGACPRANRL